MPLIKSLNKQWQRKLISNEAIKPEIEIFCMYFWQVDELTNCVDSMIWILRRQFPAAVFHAMDRAPCFERHLLF